MSDTAAYEYIVRAIDGDGRVLDESRPRPHALSWTPGIGAAMWRTRYRDVRVAQLRRRAGSDDPWEELTEAEASDAAPELRRADAMSVIEPLSLYAWVSYHVGTPIFAVWVFPLMVSWRLVPGSRGYVVLRAIAAEVRPLVGPFVVGQVPAVAFLAAAGRTPLVFFYMFGVWLQLVLWVLLRGEPRDDRWQRRRRRAWRLLRGAVRLPRLSTSAQPAGGHA